MFGVSFCNVLQREARELLSPSCQNLIIILSMIVISIIDCCYVVHVRIEEVVEVIRLLIDGEVW